MGRFCFQHGSSTEKTLAEQEHAGAGHNSAAQREEVVWERWTKKRTFVRALEGTYGELVREAREIVVC